MVKLTLTTYFWIANHDLEILEPRNLNRNNKVRFRGIIQPQKKNLSHIPCDLGIHNFLIAMATPEEAATKRTQIAQLLE